MKQNLLLIAILLLSIGIFAQSPESVNYQAVARNLSGVPLVNQSVDVRFTIHQGSSTGTTVFQETHATSTNQFGLINLAIGSVNTSAFPLINWGLGTFFLRVEINDGSGFADMGSTQLLSVPYALYAKESGNGPTGAPGHNSLIQSTLEPAGANCTNGGYFVQSWLDLDDDGTISVGETSVDYYICNGVDGVDGVNGTNGANGTDGVGITSTVDNGDGTFTINYSDATSFTTSDLTGPAGTNGTNGAIYSAGPGISLLGDSITNLGDADNDPTNEIELPATGVTNDVLTWNGSAWVSQAPVSGADNWGTEVVNVSGTNISGDGTILNPIIVTDNDDDSTNELELPMVGNTIGDVLYWDGSNWIAQAPASGADDWGTQTVVSDASLTGDGTAATPLAAVPYTPGTAIDITGNVVTNTAPDQTVLLQSAGATTVSGTYPSFTISSTDNVNDADSDPTNEIELPATAITNQVLTWNGSAWVAQNAGSGADNWGTQVVQVDGTTITGDGDTTPLSGFDGDYGSLSNTPLIPTNTSDLTNDSGFITNANDADFDPTNEIELPATASTNDVLIWNGSAWVAGTAAADGDGNSTNEIQNLSVSGNNLNISGGTGTTISATAPTTGDMLYYNGTNWVAQAVPADNVNDADFDPTNEIELPATASTNDVLIWNGSAWVAGTAAADGDGNSTNEIQDVSITGNAVGITGGTGFNLSSNGPTTGDMLFWDGASWTAQPVAAININDADSDPTNEYQTLSFANPNLTLSDGGGTIDLSGLTSTTYWSPSGSDIYSNNTGNVGIGISPVHKLDVSGDINLNGVYRIDGSTFLDNINNNTLVGATGNSSLTTGQYNTVVGQIAGQQLSTGLRNTLMGRAAGNAVSSEFDNTLIGAGAGQGLTGGSENTMLGSYAGWSLTNTGTRNTYIGTYSGQDNTTGSRNTFLGNSAGNSITAGSDNTFLGYQSGENNSTGGGNVFLGAYAGQNELGSNHLFIDNSNTNTPLIWGDFGLNLLQFNGAVNINNAYTLPSVDGASSGLALITDAAGNVSWGTPSTTSFWGGSAGVVYPATITDNLGIGTASPSEKLHVYVPAGSGNISLETPFAGDLSYKIKNTNTEFAMLLNGTKLHFREGAGDVMTLGSSNVGVGTTNPLYRFHVENATSRRTGYFMNMTNAANIVNDELMGVYGGAHGAGASDKIGGFFETSSGSGVNYGVYAQALGGTTNWAGYFGQGDVYIQNNLGIGIIAPLHKLDVNGTIQGHNFVYSTPKERYYTIGENAFRLANSAGSDITSSFGVGGVGIINSTGVNALVAPVNLPHGAVVTAVDVYYVDNSAANMVFYFQRRNLVGSASTIFNFTTGEQSTAVEIANMGGGETIDNENNSYTMRMYSTGWPAGGTKEMEIKTVKITYTILETD